jgi:hypothetical protein
MVTRISMLKSETIKYMDRLCCNSGYLKNTQTQHMTHSPHIHRPTHPDDWQVNAAAAHADLTSILDVMSECSVCTRLKSQSKGQNTYMSCCLKFAKQLR